MPCKLQVNSLGYLSVYATNNICAKDYIEYTLFMQIQSTLRVTDKVTVDWISMSKTVSEYPQELIAGTKFFTDYLNGYDWKAWSDVMNYTLNMLMSSDSTQYVPSD